MFARLQRGARIKTIARDLGVARNTVKPWQRLGGWRLRPPVTRPCQIDPYRPFVERHGPEVQWNGRVLHRERQRVGFAGTYQQVQRAIQPLHADRAWATVTTVRFKSSPGQQAHVDCGQICLWIGDRCQRIHVFVMTLSYSRRVGTGVSATSHSVRCWMGMSRRSSTSVGCR